MTAFVASFDPETGTLRYASAGHEPVAVSEPGMPTYGLNMTAPMLAVFDNPKNLFRGSSLKVKSRTLLVAATDGLINAGRLTASSSVWTAFWG